MIAFRTGVKSTGAVTVIVWVDVAMLPAASVDVHATIVMPSVENVAGASLETATPGQLSDADGGVNTEEDVPIKIVTGLREPITGISLSVTVTV